MVTILVWSLLVKCLVVLYTSVSRFLFLVDLLFWDLLFFCYHVYEVVPCNSDVVHVVKYNSCKYICSLLGLIRQVQYLSQNHLLGRERPLKLVVDAGTGTTAVGLALGAICLGCVLVCITLSFLLEQSYMLE